VKQNMLYEGQGIWWHKYLEIPQGCADNYAKMTYIVKYTGNLYIQFSCNNNFHLCMYVTTCFPAKALIKLAVGDIFKKGLGHVHFTWLNSSLPHFTIKTKRLFSLIRNTQDLKIIKIWSLSFYFNCCIEVKYDLLLTCLQSFPCIETVFFKF